MQVLTSVHHVGKQEEGKMFVLLTLSPHCAANQHFKLCKLHICTIIRSIPSCACYFTWSKFSMLWCLFQIQPGYHVSYTDQSSLRKPLLKCSLGILDTSPNGMASISCYVWGVLRPASFQSLQLSESVRIVHPERGADLSRLCWLGHNESVTHMWY